MESLIFAISEAILPDSLAISITQWFHDLEEWELPMPSPTTVMWSTIVGVPLALAAHDSSEKLLPATTQLPIVSWFQRRWKKNEKVKSRDLYMMRDGVIFAYIAASLYEGNAKMIPLDYLADRLMNATTRTILTREIQNKRSSTYSAAQGVLQSGAAFDGDKLGAMKETAMRRRMVQENIQ